MTPSDLACLDAQLDALHLHHVKGHYQDLATAAAHKQISHLEYLAELIEGEAARRKGGRMETGRQVDRGSEAGPLERDGAHRFGFGVAAVAAAVALAMAWRAYQRGRGETIAAAEARMEPRPVVY